MKFDLGLDKVSLLVKDITTVEDILIQLSVRVYGYLHVLGRDTGGAR